MQSGSSLFGLFELRCSLFRDFRFTSQTEKHINIRFDGVDLLRLFLEAGSSLVEPLLLLNKSFLLGLERLQAGQFTVSLHCQKVALCCVEDDQLGFVLCSESYLVLCLLEGIIDRLEPLIVTVIFYEWLHFSQTSFHTFQLIAGTSERAVDIINLSLKISIVEKIILGEEVESTRSFLEVLSFAQCS